MARFTACDDIWHAPPLCFGFEAEKSAMATIMIKHMNHNSCHGMAELTLFQDNELLYIPYVCVLHLAWLCYDIRIRDRI